MRHTKYGKVRDFLSRLLNTELQGEDGKRSMLFPSASTAMLSLLDSSESLYNAIKKSKHFLVEVDEDSEGEALLWRFKEEIDCCLNQNGNLLVRIHQTSGMEFFSVYIADENSIETDDRDVASSFELYGGLSEDEQVLLAMRFYVLVSSANLIGELNAAWAAPYKGVYLLGKSHMPQREY